MKNIYTIIFLFSICNTFGQSKLDRAKEHFKEFRFDKAIEIYEDLSTSRKGNNHEVWQGLADSYFNLTDYSNAAVHYQKLYVAKGEKIGEGNVIKLIQSLKASNKMDEANEIIHTYYTDSERLKMILDQKEALDSLLEAGDAYTVANLPLNSKKSDFAPAFYIDQMVFASARDTLKHNGKLYPWNKQPYLDMYITNPEIEGYIPEKFLNNIQTKYHDATFAYSWLTNKIYFTRNFLQGNRLDGNSEGLSNMQIFMGTVSRSTLVEQESLDFNSKDYSCAHPAISPDGRYLFFTSDMPGGYGETDIYVVEISKDGRPFTPPMNLGPTINTPGREMFPFLSKDKMLYFASDGHYGLGGLDVFASRMITKSEYTMPENMGQPINSNMDDFSLIYDNEEEMGYLASNRFGGVGDDDIYRFDKKKPVDCLVYSGTVVDKVTGLPIYDATVELYNEEDGMVMFLRTNEEGTFELTLPCSKENQLIFSKPQYTKEMRAVTTGENVEKPSRNNIIELIPYESLVKEDEGVEKIIVEPIYFEYDKWDITPRAEIELEKVLFAMREFPKLKIKIESHTDSRGSDPYNMRLSDKRAKSTRIYLIAQGIDPVRIESANGYGEYQLKNECDDGVPCSEKQHFENRRSDFIVVAKE